jgi:hypothetical protein
MIPQRSARNNFAGSEVSERVTACRKRLRVNRFTHKQASRELDEDSCAQKATFPDDEAPMRESLSSSDLSLAAPDGRNDKHEMLLTLRAQEVGIT